MAACSFVYPFAGDPTAGLVAARKAIQDQGGTMRGDTNRGSATVPSPLGDVSFTYQLVAGKLYVDVTDKPFLVSCGQLDSLLKQALASAPKAVAGAKPAAPKPQPLSTSAATTIAAAGASAGKVTTLPVQHIYGEVPRQPSSGMWVWLGIALGAVAAASLGMWLGRQRR